MLINTDASLKVCEIFTSIQGESSYAGVPCAFVRLTGCNLRCRYCDTVYAYSGGYELTIAEIIVEVQKSGIKLVEITGGEPLLQENSASLIDALIAEGNTVLIETNGSISLEVLGKRTDNPVTVIMDIKTPASGMSAHNDFLNFDLLLPHDEIKFVLSDENDYVWAVDLIKTYELSQKCRILFSAETSFLSHETLASWIIRDALPVRLNVQLHKYIFTGDMRGR
ncbi:radical SAM protein [Candidatus Magnetomonas plexicatena]|uniref:radical SAM protein n=1 Tax=Candidatus Magnetomonas plexicatena TaxID=2552947 RepID=UPI001C781DF9|nr:radical SAM protein [Nitrospirales bacterium LBB_01]